MTLSRSRFPWEQEALDFVFERFPAQDNYRAWANFEFIADDGSINEVDILVACPQGIFLIEIKSRPGTVRGDVFDYGCGSMKEGCRPSTTRSYSPTENVSGSSLSS